MRPVIAPPSLPLVAISHFALTKTDWYRRAVVALYDAGLQTGVDPVVLAAQCGNETGFGRFGGAVTEEHGNTCGLKIRSPKGDGPADHARFPVDQWGFPRVGALAHAHHLRLYAGLPVPEDTPDPRAVWINPGSPAFGSAEVVIRLGTRWAPAADYGIKIEAIMQQIYDHWGNA